MSPHIKLFLLVFFNILHFEHILLSSCSFFIHFSADFSFQLRWNSWVPLFSSLISVATPMQNTRETSPGQCAGDDLQEMSPKTDRRSAWWSHDDDYDTRKNILSHGLNCWDSRPQQWVMVSGYVYGHGHRYFYISAKSA